MRVEVDMFSCFSCFVWWFQSKSWFFNPAIVRSTRSLICDNEETAKRLSFQGIQGCATRNGIISHNLAQPPTRRKDKNNNANHMRLPESHVLRRYILDCAAHLPPLKVLRHPLLASQRQEDTPKPLWDYLGLGSMFVLHYWLWGGCMAY